MPPRRALTEKTYDFIIINAPLHDDTGIRFAIDTCSNKQSVVLLLVKSDIHNSIHDQVLEYGVFTLSKPLSKATMAYALSWLEAPGNACGNLRKNLCLLKKKWLKPSGQPGKVDFDQPAFHE